MLLLLLDFLVQMLFSIFAVLGNKLLKSYNFVLFFQINITFLQCYFTKKLHL